MNTIGLMACVIAAPIVVYAAWDSGVYHGNPFYFSESSMHFVHRCKGSIRYRRNGRYLLSVLCDNSNEAHTSNKVLIRINKLKKHNSTLLGKT
ncbi:hypothetical protein BpHYR1_016696 [Brachionus plicatilis]|uniref:Uncharacterized protein n=1 Tax=Brachionus plicatilis TaxID=10195 RepID=A0A3M7RHB4_BRAPC|nr:hypothetical protein BpHYR1_016696 [Brachionus plicatilis]